MRELLLLLVYNRRIREKEDVRRRGGEWMRIGYDGLTSGVYL